MPRLVQDVTDAAFDTVVLKSSIPVLVDFWAPWCPPCRSLAPFVESAAKNLNGKVLVCKLNVDENPATAAKFHVRGIPALILFENGVRKTGVTGMGPATLEFLNSLG